LLSSLYDRIIGILQKYDVSFQEFTHEPILNYEDAEREKKRFGWNGAESKNVFMKGSDDKYYLFVTLQGVRVDFKQLKDILGVKLCIASEEDVKTVIHCVPGCVAPFGFSADIAIILDPAVFVQTFDDLPNPKITLPSSSEQAD
jgi:Ala-tRNA(Pro) deacylase